MTGSAATFRRAAVLGAGVMGAQIAAQLANSGFETLLFEMAAEGDDPRADARRAIDGLRRQRPAPLVTPAHAGHIRPATYHHDGARLADCDLVIEAVAERLAIKQALFEQVAEHLGPAAVIGSNTSGLSISAIASVLPASLRGRFCGIHFFNPPRYMHLVELTPGPETDPAVLDRLETMLTTDLGKGVLRARDTPNFIANRIGVFAIVTTLQHAEAHGIPPETVDALTGTAIGRPKSATFRTLDVVGLDTFRHVVEGAIPRLEDDPWAAAMALPAWIARLVDAGALGAKSGAGIYRKTDAGIEVMDPASGDYRASEAEPTEAVRSILKETDAAGRLAALRASDDAHARFLWAIHRDLFHYAACHLESIAETARDVDLAMRWGFGWERGPFEQWQAAGWQAIADAVSEDIAAGRTGVSTPLPDWVRRIGAVHDHTGSWSPRRQRHEPRSALPVYRRQRFPAVVLGAAGPDPGVPTFETPAVRLWHTDPDVGVISFSTARGTIGAEVLDGVMQAVAAGADRYAALVVWQPSAPFSLGADLKQVVGALDARDFDRLETMVRDFQSATAALRDAPVPVVAGLNGMALGGGCEFAMHCDHVVAAQESYPGLVEAGVGLIPAGGGCRELARRAARQAPDGDPFPFLRQYFEAVARARVAGSAQEAMDFGLLTADTTVVPHADEVLHVALAMARGLAETAYRPPLARPIRAAGRNALATFRGSIVNLREGGFISGHDAAVADAAARALCGGGVESGESVDEHWFLRLEREGFMELLRSEATGDRIRHTLATGRPLRN